MTTLEDPTLACLLAAVLADPGDDLPRLAFADRLEEAGADARAEFVRVQVEIARRERGESLGHAPPGGLWHPAIDGGKLAARELELLRRHGAELLGFSIRWCAEVAAAGTRRVPPVAIFRRGFVSEVWCPQSDWLRHGPALARLHPVEKVTLSDKEPFVAVVPDGRGGPAVVSRVWYGNAPPGENAPDARLFGRLTRGELGSWGREDCRRYRPGEDPAADLSLACLAWARLPEGER